MQWLVQLAWAFLALLAVDFCSGLVHWTEDTFGTPQTPVFGRWIVAPNVLHHHDATAFVSKGWWASSWDLLLAVLAIGAFVCWQFGFSWQLALFCLVGANANQIHKWNHLGPARVGPHVRFCWRTEILQGPAQHAVHHAGEQNTRYCVVTPLLNPLLDSLGFWRLLERVFVPLFGAPRRADIRFW
jgi:ubiquitin-conjugating enzyme E2 variant